MTTQFRILIVDDNPAIHDDFRKILTPHEDDDDLDAFESAVFGEREVTLRGPKQPDAEFRLDYAHQGEVALELVQRATRERAPYALAFVDVRMPPGWTGIETVKRLWRVDPELQIVICTAYSDHSWGDIARELDEATNWLILKKPFDPVEILQLAHSLTGKWQLWQRNRELMVDLNNRLQRELDKRADAENELRRAHRLEAVGRLAAAVGHEINNPLAFVMANFDYIRDQLVDFRDRLPDEVASEIVEVLDDTARGTARIKRIVRDLRVLSRDAADDGATVSIADALSMSIKTVRAELPDGIELSSRVDVAPSVRIERVRLEQVFVNLLMNAVQAVAGQSGERAICAEVEPAAAGTVTISVRDTGPGIPADIRDNIFDPFYTTKTMGAGSGLGLSICHGIVSQAGGYIDVDSSPKGTVFRVCLPLADSTPAVEPAPVVQAPTGVSKLSILVIDDEHLVLRALERLLSDHNVIAVCSGREALEHLADGEFDVVLCDLMMKEISGMDVYRLACAHDMAAAARFVFMTGGVFTDGAAEFLADPNVDWIEKPIVLPELMQALTKSVNKSGRARAVPVPSHT